MRRLLSVIPLIALLIACGGESDSNPIAPTTPPQPFTQTDLRVGTGAEAVNGKRLTVNYAGWLYSATAAENKGSLFGTSVGSTPLAFTLGAGAVIPGMDQGLVGMKVGGVRRLVIPPALAYGTTGFGPVPPNANLVYEVELLNVE